VTLPGEMLDACLANDAPRARAAADFSFPEDFASASEWIAFRRNQVIADAAWELWSLRGMILRDERRMIGFTSFHGPPGINSLEAEDAVEIGYTVFEEDRGRGFATETARAMMDWARREHGIRRFISSIEPGNAPSIHIIEKLGFRRIGLVLEGEEIFELIDPRI
jgi:RimJ/RimL family protein N-acetyltransferase